MQNIDRILVDSNSHSWSCDEEPRVVNNTSSKSRTTATLASIAHGVEVHAHEGCVTSTTS